MINSVTPYIVFINKNLKIIHSSIWLISFRPQHGSSRWKILTIKILPILMKYVF